MTYLFSNQNIFIATDADIPAITSLINSAYRGPGSKQGWTTEENLIAGDTRITEEGVRQLIHQENAVFLKYTDDEQRIIGCVNLRQDAHKVYLGLLCVSPQLQGSGTGKYLLKAAEEYAEQVQSSIIYMTVITLRPQLINWYQRRGYQDTGERIPFMEDPVSGKHLQPLEFMVLEKVIQY